MREATLSVLDIFGQPVEEDEPMLMPLGHDSSAPDAGPIPGGTLVHQYLKQNSQVDMN